MNQTMPPRPEIKLEVYNGPLDLLLALIEQQRLEITVVSLAQVAEQYMAAMAALEQPDPDLIAEFLVIGAKLLVIKTRALLPRPPVELLVPDEDDVGDQLARQLLEYSRFKQAALSLRAWESQGRRVFARVHAAPLPPLSTPADLDVSLGELVAAMQRRLRLLPGADATVPLPASKIITIADVTERITALLNVQRRAGFVDLLDLAVTRSEVIVTLWTVLELWKRGMLAVTQPELFGAIAIERGPEWVSMNNKQ